MRAEAWALLGGGELVALEALLAAWQAAGPLDAGLIDTAAALGPQARALPLVRLAALLPPSGGRGLAGGHQRGTRGPF